MQLAQRGGLRVLAELDASAGQGPRARPHGRVGQAAQQQPVVVVGAHDVRGDALTRCRHRPSKRAVALLRERGHAFDEVGRRRGQRLEVTFELERVGEAVLEGRVQQPLREAEGARRTRRRAAHDLFRRAAASVVGVVDAPVREPEVDGLRPVTVSPSITIALARARPTRRGGDTRRRRRRRVPTWGTST